MMSDEEKKIFEKAKSALIKLGKYSDDKENIDTTKINDKLLKSLLNSAFIGMGEGFSKVKNESILNKDIRKLYLFNLLNNSFDYEIDKKREILSRVFPALKENGLIDTNDLTLIMMEEVYNTQREIEIIKWQQDQLKGIRRMQPMTLEEWPFLNGAWRQHASEYVIAKSVLDGYGIDVKEEDVKKVWEERNFELFKRNNPGSSSPDER